MTIYTGEIRMIGANFAPENWLLCNGQELQISDYPQLAAVIGITYGGDGSTTFQLPDLQGRMPLSKGQGAGLSNRILGSKGGSDEVSLELASMPKHAHGLQVTSTEATQIAPYDHIPAQTSGTTAPYIQTPPTVGFYEGAVETVGEGQAHENRMPLLGINYMICTEGVNPSSS